MSLSPACQSTQPPRLTVLFREPVLKTGRSSTAGHTAAAACNVMTPSTPLQGRSVGRSVGFPFPSTSPAARRRVARSVRPSVDERARGRSEPRERPIQKRQKRGTEHNSENSQHRLRRRPSSPLQYVSMSRSVAVLCIIKDSISVRTAEGKRSSFLLML